MRRLLAAVAVLVVLVVLAGCTSGTDDGPTESSPSPSASGSASAGEESTASAEARTAPPPAPAEGACYRIAFEQLARTTNASEPVRCAGPHDAQTIHVGRIDTTVGGREVTADSDEVRAQLARTCSRRMAAHLGGTPQARDLSRFEVVWFSPTPEQLEQGADWFRCDLVAIAAEDRLHRLPPPRRTAGLLDREGALATFGLCGTAEPGTPRFERVICDRPHTWRAIATLPLPGGDSYPGTARVRRAGDAPCRDRAREQADDPLQFEYGWEWPTRQQWQHGQRFGYCWSPA